MCVVFTIIGNPFKINRNMIMDEVVLDEVSLGAPGQGGLPGQGNGMSANQNRAQKRQAEASPTQLGLKRAKKGIYLYTFHVLG